MSTFNREDLGVLAKTLGKATREAIEKARAPLLERIADLEGRLVSVEKRLAAHDSRHDAQAKHLQSIERKVGGIINGSDK